MDFQPMSPDDRLDRLSEKTERIASSMISVAAMLEQLITEQQATHQRVDRLHEVMMQRLPRDNDA